MQSHDNVGNWVRKWSFVCCIQLADRTQVGVALKIMPFEGTATEENGASFIGVVTWLSVIPVGVAHRRECVAAWARRSNAPDVCGLAAGTNALSSCPVVDSHRTVLKASTRCCIWKQSTSDECWTPSAVCYLIKGRKACMMTVVSHFVCLSRVWD